MIACLNTDAATAAFHFEDTARAEFLLERSERPPRRVEHAERAVSSHGNCRGGRPRRGDIEEVFHLL